MKNNFLKSYQKRAFLSNTSLDAVLIGIAWHSYFCMQTGAELKIIHLMIIGLSIWLGYMSDRLFDVEKLPIETHWTRRHLFAKRNKGSLWILWTLLLVVNIGMSIAYLEAKQLFIGLKLTAFVLLYTLCNQYLFKKRFPKEFFVALLYAYGVFFLIEPKITNKELYLFASVCLLNCLLISKKEASIDRLNEMRSIGSYLSDSVMQLVLLLFSIIYFLLNPAPNIYLSISLSLLVVTVYKERIDTERYRALIEGIYFSYPVLFLLF